MLRSILCVSSMIAHYLAICGPKRWPHILGLLYLGSYPTNTKLQRMGSFYAFSYSKNAWEGLLGVLFRSYAAGGPKRGCKPPQPAELSGGNDPRQNGPKGYNSPDQGINFRKRIPATRISIKGKTFAQTRYHRFRSEEHTS